MAIHIAQRGKNAGRPVTCQAKVKCTLKGEDGNPAPHFDSKEEAEAHLAQQAEKEHGAFNTVSRKTADKSPLDASHIRPEDRRGNSLRGWNDAEVFQEFMDEQDKINTGFGEYSYSNQMRQELIGRMELPDETPGNYVHGNNTIVDEYLRHKHIDDFYGSSSSRKSAERLRQEINDRLKLREERDGRRDRSVAAFGRYLRRVEALRNTPEPGDITKHIESMSTQEILTYIRSTKPFHNQDHGAPIIAKDELIKRLDDKFDNNHPHTSRSGRYSLTRNDVLVERVMDGRADSVDVPGVKWTPEEKNGMEDELAARVHYDLRELSAR